MIALDTNALVRLLVMDNEGQAGKVAQAVMAAENNSEQILILPEVLIETSWVLESIYSCERRELVDFLETLISSSTFTFPDPAIIRRVVDNFRKGGDFADHMIIEQARKLQARKVISFDRKLQKRFSGFVVDSFD